MKPVSDSQIKSDVLQEHIQQTVKEQPDDCRNNCEAILELDRRCDMVATQAEKDAARGFLGPNPSGYILAKHAARMAFDGYGGEPQVDGMFVSEHGTGNWIAPTLKTIGRFKQHQVISRRDWVGTVTMLEGFLKRESSIGLRLKKTEALLRHARSLCTVRYQAYQYVKEGEPGYAAAGDMAVEVTQHIRKVEEVIRQAQDMLPKSPDVEVANTDQGDEAP